MRIENPSVRCAKINAKESEETKEIRRLILTYQNLSLQQYLGVWKEVIYIYWSRAEN